MALMSAPLLAQQDTLSSNSATKVADTLAVSRYSYVGPLVVQAPVMFDTLDVKGKKYDAKSLLDVPTTIDAVRQGTAWQGEALPGSPDGTQYALHQLGFTLTNQSYAKVKLIADKAPAQYQLYLDGAKSSVGELSLEPGTHQLVVKYLSDTVGARQDSLQLRYTCQTSAVRSGVMGQEPELYTIDKMRRSYHNYGLSISPKGDYLILSNYDNSYSYYLEHCTTGRRTRLHEYVRWMPKSNRYYFTRQGLQGRELVTVDPATGQEQVIGTHLPEGHFTLSPTEDKLFFTNREEGPKELNGGVREVLNPEDRQPGWRDRSSIWVFDLATGVKRPLTFGYSNFWLSDISEDGRYLLIGKSELTFKPLGEGKPVDRPVRPHEFTSYYRLDLQTLATDTLVVRDGFVASPQLSPDGTQLLVKGSPEAFDRIGCTLAPEVIPSIFDNQAYIVDVATREVRPMTRDFDPSVSHMYWSSVDNMIYLTAENRDSVSLYRMDPKTGDIRMLALPEENIFRFSMASQSPMMAFSGQSAMNSDRLYTVDLSKLKADRRSRDLQSQLRCVEDLSAVTLRDTEVAECRRWTFRNSIGDEVLCRYYIPVGLTEDGDGRLVAKHDGLDVPADGSVPMITYYYGGCSPTTRSFESSYPWQCWAALGYAVLVVQPSGAAGFGQEWASRHVNTAGVDPARDITEAVREFSRTHVYINKEKVGCCGASYGGFMTQYLQTLPDCPFACAISHAGISDHTTYWGYGYWGYSYSEVSMANSYPWSETELYVKNSPIYNVDKIHTPILFLHGTKDVNVPINNSIQMFTALKLLGRETALVCVEGEDHGVVDRDKRQAWLKTQLAWFQKYLKDDATWWDALYPKKTL